MTNEEAREHMDMLIAHKDLALETHPYFKRCDSCIHSEEQDGSNCYECIKGMANNFETQSTKMRDATEEERKSVKDYVESISKPTGFNFYEAQPCDDCISRSELLRHQHIIYDDDGEDYNAVYVKDIKALPSVTPTSEDIKEAYLKGYDYGVKDWFKSKTQPCEYCEHAMPLVSDKSGDKGVSLMYPNTLSAYGYDIHGSDSNGLCVKINYCPMCGRELR